MPEIEVRVHGAIRAQAEELRCSDVVVGGTTDHVHVFCRFPPVLALSKLVQQLKGESSHFVTHRLEGFPHFKWQGSYGALTVDRYSTERIRRYVLNQKTHHSQQRLEDEWERDWIEDEIHEP